MVNSLVLRQDKGSNTAWNIRYMLFTPSSVNVSCPSLSLSVIFVPIKTYILNFVGSTFSTSLLLTIRFLAV